MTLTISIITPSFNQADFFPQCLESVANQSYPAIEHLVYDPGSTDGSRDIVASYPHATLFAEPDKGQSDAVSKGFVAAKGDIIGWLNSDDCYASEDVLATVVERFQQPDAPDIVYGRGAYIDDKSQFLRDAYVNESPETLTWRLHKEVGILQPTLFLRRSVVEALGVLSEELHFCMDYDYWIRAMKAGLKFAFIPKVIAFGRYYEDNKTLGRRGESLREICDTVKGHFDYLPVEWAKRYAEFKAENFDGILADSANSVVKNPETLDRETKYLLESYNTSYDTLQLLRENAGKRPYSLTVNAMKEYGISLEHSCQLIPLDRKTVPYCFCYTVGEKRWAFPRKWKEEQLEKTQQTFEKLKANRKQDICIIVGNGPSLKDTNLSLLKGQDVFITNYAFLNAELLSYAKYLAVTNYLVAEQGAHQFNLLEGVNKLFPYWLRYCINDGENTFVFNSVGKPEFSKNIYKNVSWRSTVSFFQMQIAYGLGYRQVLLIGFDHSYSQDTSAKEGDILLCKEDDVNHFHPRYFKGKRWQAADVDNMEAMYALAKQAFEEDDREIINCTVGGHLELFARGNLEDYLGEKKIREDSIRRMLAFKNKHQGQRCVIIGNGPSLNQMDLSFLKNEICFGLNKIYLGFEKWDFVPDYYVAVNDLVIEQSAELLSDIPCTKFLSDRAISLIPSQNDIIFIKTDDHEENGFGIDPEVGFQEGATVTYVAMQLAYYMGFKTVILIGVDHYYKTPVSEPHQQVIALEDDVNHFDSNYFGKGVKWNTPDLEESEKYYRIANIRFRSDGRQIIDATVGGKCEVFPKKHYKDIFFTNYPIAKLQTLSQKQKPDIIHLDSEVSVERDPKVGITIFAIPKPFKGQISIIQRNAIKSWTLLKPQPEIILFGDEAGVAETARELGLRHVPTIERNEFGTPLLSTVFTSVQEIARNQIVTYINCDLILTSNFTLAVQQASVKFNDFLITGRRWDVDISALLNFESSSWENQLCNFVYKAGWIAADTARDYFVFPKNLFSQIPNYAVGRGYWDSWMLNEALEKNYPVVDASEVIFAIHQNHVYSHLKGGKNEAHMGIEAEQNKAIGKIEKLSAIRDATCQLKPLYLNYLPQLTVVITTQNDSRSLPQAIESVLAQSYTDYEIIVVDDSSTDDVRNILKPYYNCLRYVYQEPQGILTARNQGINLARGEFITFLEADGCFLPNALEKQVGCFENDLSTLDIVFSGWKAKAGDRDKITDVEPWHQLPNLDEHLHIWNLWKNWKPISTSMMMFRRSRLEKLGGFNTQLCEEVSIVDLVLRLTLLKGCRPCWLYGTTSIYSRKLEQQIENPHRLAKDFEIVLDNYFARADIQKWMRKLEPVARYNTLLWLAWLMDIAGCDGEKNKYLQRSYGYSLVPRQENTNIPHARFSLFCQWHGYESHFFTPSKQHSSNSELK